MLPGLALEVLNVGDSGMRIVRAGAVAWKTTVLQHEFNMPFQLANEALLPETDFPCEGTLSTVDCQVCCAADLCAFDVSAFCDVSLCFVAEGDR